MSDTALLQLSGISKAFAAPVLTNIDFELLPGEIHALMGSNGAGKSTLCNLVTGIHQPNAGSMTFDGKTHQPASIKNAEQLGIQMVMQELSLFPTLSIAENLCFKKLGSQLGIIRHAELRTRANETLALMGLEHLDPDTPISALGVGQQQLIEIAGAISQPVKLLILDEPTASLTDPEIETLFKRLNDMRAQGVSVIYISHRMDEISRIADRVSVLRDGELVATVPTADVTADQIVTLMAGELPDQQKESAQPAAETSAKSSQELKPLIRVENLSIADAIENINLEIRAGEVLGIGGLIGSGRTELLRAIFGADRAQSGCIRLASEDFKQARRMGSPKEAISAGIGLVVEDRKQQGLLLSDSISTNVCLGKFNDLSNRLSIVNADQEQITAEQVCADLAVKYDDLAQPVQQLSGGNQQKILIARWLLKDLDVLMFDEPSRGVDARAKASIQNLIRDLASSGKALVVVSSETDELIRVSNRILVMSNGRLAGEFDAESVTEEHLLEASFKFYSRTDSATGDGSSDKAPSQPS